MNDSKQRSAIVILENLSKVFKTGPEELVIFENLDTTIDKGSLLVISGESGSGKSTLLNLIGGLDQVSSGSITVDGHRVTALGEERLSLYRRKTIGFIFQFHYLLKEFTALENVMLPAFIAGESRRASLEKAEALLEEVRLGSRRHHYPLQLSGGERQRVAVARSLICEPEVILADEPTGNLDEANSRTVEELLFSLVKNHGKTLILVTHDSAVKARGDRKFRLEHGRLVEE